MGSLSPSELSLDYKPINGSFIFGDQSEKLEEFLSRLEEERLKIDAFKRELPLCMQLLNNAMEAYRQQLEAYQGQKPPVLEEFIPIKQKTAATEAAEKPPSKNTTSEKANWMTSAQLWTQQSNNVDKNHNSASVAADHRSFDAMVSPRLALDSKQRNGGGFLPFTKEGSKSSAVVVPDLALGVEVVVEKKCLESSMVESSTTKRESGDSSNRGGGGRAVAVAEQGKVVANPPEVQAAAAATTQTRRKARRCWSPDLHRRFVNALQMLGGSQVATPKQIRELMKVDGLTNDEVKSHLQKYRLHTRRPIPAPQAAPPPGAAQLVVLGGIWVPPEYAASAAAAGAAAIYGAHPPPSAHYCTAAAAPVSHNFYPQVQAPHHYRRHGAIMAYKGGQGWPGSDVKGSGGERSTESMEDREDRAEEEEDGKSDSSNWKGGGEEEEEEKAVVDVDGDDSNGGSDATLKFD